ncbi:MAG: hypothetical protein OEZ68_19105 [Gammaproteobacteria bacterium]|nr:hypothetical protein [Gammaproteobacteria bacterium]MDH5802917.1 hypothetical protein [Gammaproteobacteria bacterium]
MSALYRLLLPFVLVLFLNGCSNDDVVQDASLLAQDLSGTWLLLNEEQFYNKATGDYLYSEFIESSVIIDDEGRRVNFYRCIYYGSLPTIGVKTDTHYYHNVVEDGYELQGDGSLQRQFPRQANQYNDTQETVRVERLIRISSDIVLDHGELIVNGVMSVNETNHVCLDRRYDSLSDAENLALSIPYIDDYVSWAISTVNGLSVNTYQYDSNSIRSEITSFYFGNYMGSVNPATATIDVTEADLGRYVGTFSFTDFAENSYSGSFEINPQY